MIVLAHFVITILQHLNIGVDEDGAMIHVDKIFLFFLQSEGPYLHIRGSSANFRERINIFT